MKVARHGAHRGEAWRAFFVMRGSHPLPHYLTGSPRLFGSASPLARGQVRQDSDREMPNPNCRSKGMRSMKRVAVPALLALALSACASTAPGVEVRTVEVPTPAPCLPPDQIPAEPEQIGDILTGKAATDLTIVSASALKLRAWGREMRSALVACAE